MAYNPKNLFSLQDKVSVVVGGSGVLGGVFAHALGSAGAKVGVVGRTPAKVDQTVQELQEAGYEAKGVVADVSKRTDVQNSLDTFVQAWGGVDILVNAPGINSATPFFEIEDEEWDSIMDVNLKSMFISSQIYGAHMKDRGQGGSIINISSISSGPPLSRVFTYGVSKAGVNNLTQWLARELASAGIRVNAIIPGFFPAEQNRRILSKERVDAIIGHTPMGRLGEPEELAGTLIWLASDKAAGFVTGALIKVDGGFSAMTI